MSLVIPMLRPILVPVVGQRGAVARYVTDLKAAGGMYYTMPSISLTDFEIEIEIATTQAGNKLLLCGNYLAGEYYLNSTDTTIVFWANGVTVATFNPATIINDGKLNKLNLKLSGSTLSCSYNDNSLGSRTITPYTGSNSFMIGNRPVGGATPTFSGSFFSTKIWNGGDRSAGTLVRDYRFNDNDGVLFDYSGSNANGASVNVNAADRELMAFNVTRNAWIGGEFVRNGDFSLGGSGWFTLGNPGGWSFDGVKAVLVGDGTAQSLEQTTLRPMSNEDNYLISFDAFSDSSSIGVQSLSGVIKLSGSSGRVSGIVKLEHTRVSFKRVLGSVNGWIDNVSVKRAIEVAS